MTTTLYLMVMSCVSPVSSFNQNTVVIDHLLFKDLPQCLRNVSYNEEQLKVKCKVDLNVACKEILLNGK